MAEKTVRVNNRPHTLIRGVVRSVRFLVPVLFLLVLTGGFVSWCYAVFRTPALVETNIAPESARAVLEGSFTAGFDRLIEDHHPAANPALHAVTAMRLALFREGSGPVVVGEQYRLYTREEFEYHPRDSDRLDERLRWVSRVVRAVAAERIVPVIVLVPSKSRVEQETVPERMRPLVDHPRYAHALRAMDGLPAIVVAPLEELQATRGSFLATDTHWSPNGARIAAEAAAAAVEAANPGPIAPGTVVEAGRGEPVVHEGDLLRFLPLGPWSGLFELEHEVIYPRETVLADFLPTGGLFDLPSLPLTLVGTSFSVSERWNFAGELQYALQAEVLNVAREGRGPFVPMHDYLTGETYREIPPSVIVWEIPERYLTLPGIELPEFLEP
jgi:alginate O-acetyltransferase complex protein AlgJ